MNTMMKTLALIVIVGVSTSLACGPSGGGGVSPSPQQDCEDGTRCPEYTVVEAGRGYERRAYGPGLWVSTRVAGMGYQEATREGFMRLFSYIQGENEQNTKIAMTSPVVDKVMANEDWTDFHRNLTISFYVSSEFMEDGPPRPTNPDVHVMRAPAMEVYARTFSGYANADMYMEHAVALATLLSEAEEPFECGYFATAGYDSPMHLFNRRNEVWFGRLAEGEIPSSARCRHAGRDNQ